MPLLPTHKILPDTNTQGHPANVISIITVSGLSSNNVQSAVEELNTNINTKFNSSGGTITGDVIVSGNTTTDVLTANTIYAKYFIPVEYSVGNSTGDIIWDSATDTYNRTVGSPLDPVVTTTHSNIRRCLLNDDGTVNYYLNSTNSTLKITGDPANLSGVDGMVMVEIPKFYVKYSIIGTLNTWSISDIPASGYSLHPVFIVDGVEVDYRYISAYDSCVYTGIAYESGLNYDDNIGAGRNWNTASAKLASVTGQFPACGITRSEARILAANRGDRWRIQDCYLTAAIQLLYLIEYGSFNSQLKISNGNTRHTTWPNSSANQADSRANVSGLSNAIGNLSGGFATGTINTFNNGDFMSYRGIENFFGNVWNYVDGFNINSNQGYVVNENRRSFLADDTTTNYSVIGTGMPTTDNYIRNIQPLSYAFLPSSVGGSSNTYITDYYYQSTGWRVAIFGGIAYIGLFAGAFCWFLNNASSVVHRSIGARLVY